MFWECFYILPDTFKHFYTHMHNLHTFPYVSIFWTNRHTKSYCNSKTEWAQWADSLINLSLIFPKEDDQYKTTTQPYGVKYMQF